MAYNLIEAVRDPLALPLYLKRNNEIVWRHNMQTSTEVLTGSAASRAWPLGPMKCLREPLADQHQR